MRISDETRQALLKDLTNDELQTELDKRKGYDQKLEVLGHIPMRIQTIGGCHQHVRIWVGDNHFTILDKNEVRQLRALLQSAINVMGDE